MRYLLGSGLALALVAPPLSASAQVNDEGQAAESADTPKAARGLQRWHPDAYVDPVTGATLSDAGESNFEIGYETQSKAHAPLTAKEQQVRRAKIGLCVSIVPVVVGGVMAAAAVGPMRVFDFSDGSSSDSGGDAALYAACGHRGGRCRVDDSDGDRTRGPQGRAPQVQGSGRSKGPMGLNTLVTRVLSDVGAVEAQPQGLAAP